MWRCNEKVSGGSGMTNAISVKEEKPWHTAN